VSDLGGPYLWKWEIRRVYYVLVNPSGRDQIRVKRKHPDVEAALAKHCERWGAGSLDVSRQVTGGEAGELLDALIPFTKKKRGWGGDR